MYCFVCSSIAIVAPLFPSFVRSRRSPAQLTFMEFYGQARLFLLRRKDQIRIVRHQGKDRDPRMDRSIRFQPGIHLAAATRDDDNPQSKAGVFRRQHLTGGTEPSTADLPRLRDPGCSTAAHPILVVPRLNTYSWCLLIFSKNSSPTWRASADLRNC
jgi:hypothetical protein